MMKRKYRVILLAALVLGWMGVIFMFSSQDGAASSETSGRVVERVIAVVKPDFNSLAKSEQIRFREMVTFFVRKGAHFTEYMILGVLLFLFSITIFYSPIVSIILRYVLKNNCLIHNFH